MSKTISKNNHNDKRGLTDLDWIGEFYQFLQGNPPKEVTLAKHGKIKLTPKKAFSVIWFLQEHLRVLPDTIEQCDNCEGLFDSEESGFYNEKTGEHFCNGCESYYTD